VKDRDDDKGPDTVRVPRQAMSPPRPKPPPIPGALERPPTGPAIDVRAREDAAEAKRQVSQTKIEVDEDLDGMMRHTRRLESALADLQTGIVIIARATGAAAQLPDSLQRSLPPPDPRSRRPPPNLETRAKTNTRASYVAIALMVLQVLYAAIDLARRGLPEVASPTTTHAREK
jgi:hypothetical protein